MAKQALKIFIKNQEERKTTYVVDTFEQASFKFVPQGESYQVFIKWRGKKEQRIDRTAKIVMEALLGGEVIGREIYEKY